MLVIKEHQVINTECCTSYVSEIHEVIIEIHDMYNDPTIHSRAHTPNCYIVQYLPWLQVVPHR